MASDTSSTVAYLDMLLLLVMVACAAAAPPKKFHDEEFQTFKVQHGKLFVSDAEDFYRYKLFKNTQRTVAEHNRRFDNGEVAYKLGINQFADRSGSEQKQKMNLHRIVRTAPAPKKVNADQKEDDSLLPCEVDWRLKGAVTAVKDQKECESCWAFAAAGALEGQIFLKSGRLANLSVQQMVDCSFENKGCEGGLTAMAYEFVERVGGVAEEDDYRSYNATKGKCDYLSSGKGAYDYGYRAFKKDDEDVMKKAVATIGPVSAEMYATYLFSLYKSGVFECGSVDETNHGVLVVGYGTDPKHGDYWIIKNSYGSQWGEEGYMRMARNKNNTCLIASEAAVPLV